MNELKVSDSLQKAAMLAVASTDVPNTPVKYINIPFDKPDDGKWVELVHIPNPPVDTTWGNEKVYRGLFNIIVHWPNNGSGLTKALTFVDEIISYFDKSKPLDDNVRILQQPRLFSIQEEGGGVTLPIKMQYSTFSS